jgi:septum formation protein
MNRGRRATALAAVFAVLVVGGAAFLVRQTYFGPTRITAYFASATGIYPGDEVRVLGVKVGSIAAIEPATTIIGCDQLVSFEGRIFGKPGALDRAAEQLEAMSGRTHELITALVVTRGGRVLAHTDVTRLRMRRLSRAELERYVAQDRPVDCAGSYMLEERGIVLFEKIESADHTAITGLPLISLATFLRELGYSIP